MRPVPLPVCPCVRACVQATEKVDVWSMGVVMWEMFTMQAPFADMNANELLDALVHGSVALPLPVDAEPEWRTLIEACMDPNAANR